MSRKIHYGMVGGGRGAFIGAVHRIAANMDGQVELVCGAFSSDPARSKASGADFFLPPGRCYGSFQEMIEGEAAFEREFGRRKVHVVRRDDGDEVHALFRGQGLLSRDHFLEGAVAAVGREKEVRAGVAGALRVAGESAADEFDLAVDIGGDATHCADEGTASAADHAHANFSAHKVVVV